MNKFFTIALLFSVFFYSCKEKKVVSLDTIQSDLDSMRIITASQDLTISDTVEVDSSVLKKEMKSSLQETMKAMKDSLKEVIVKTEKEKVIATSTKGKKTKSDSFTKSTGMDLKFTGIVKKDTSSHHVYMLAFFNENFEGKLKLKAYDKKGESKQEEMVKVGGKFVKNDKKIDASSSFVKQTALTYTIIPFYFDEAQNLDNIDYFEISVYK